MVYGRGAVAYSVREGLTLYRGDSVNFIGQLKIWDEGRFEWEFYIVISIPVIPLFAVLIYLFTGGRQKPPIHESDASVRYFTYVK